MRVIDLFCGAGGLSEGFRQAGFTIVEGYDIWMDALTSFQLNQECSWVKCDILRKHLNFYPPADVVIGSPPCVSFSSANPSSDFRDGLKLVFRFLEVVCELKPKFWVMENVPQLGKFLPDQLATTKTSLNAADYGVAQIRERCFFGNFPRPEPTHSKHNTLDGKEKWVTMDKVLSHVKDRGQIMRAPQEGIRRHMERNHLNVLDSIERMCPTILASEENNWSLHTIYIPDGGGYRRLGTGEVAALMGFPEAYKFFGSVRSQLRQMGNAVCPPVARAIAEAIKRDVA